MQDLLHVLTVFVEHLLRAIVCVALDRNSGKVTRQQNNVHPVQIILVFIVKTLYSDSVSISCMDLGTSIDSLSSQLHSQKGRKLGIKHEEQTAFIQRDLPLVLLFYPLLQSLDIIKSQMDVCSVHCACVRVRVQGWWGGEHKEIEATKIGLIEGKEEIGNFYTYR